MIAEQEKDRQKELNSIIIYLSEGPLDKDNMENIALRLENVYKDNFRHSYSEIFPIIIDIKSEYNTLDLEYLTNNLDDIRKMIDEDFEKNGKKSKYCTLYKKYSKLCDHINLEIARLAYSERQQEMSQDILTRIEYMDNKLNEQVEKANEVEKVIDKAQRKIEEIQKESITILGVFASIVVAFTSGATFSVSVLSNMHKNNIYKITFIFLLISFMLVHAIYVLMSYIHKINKGDNFKFTYSKSIKVFTVIIICLMLAVFVLWFIDVKYLALQFQNYIQSKL